MSYLPSSGTTQVRMAYLMRSCPGLDATPLFELDEIHSVYLLNDRGADKPGLDELLRQLARLGEFLGRKSDGEPGVKNT